jgi:uncharacterized protein (DUF58 family)
MGFKTGGTGRRTKLDYAKRLAGTLAYLAANQGDAVGLYGAAAKFTKEIPPRRSAAHLRFVFDELAGMQPRGQTGLAAALHEAAERVPQRALIVIISDLFLQPADLKSCFQHLRFRKHDVAVFHLLDKSELEFEFDRPVRFLDMEGGGPVLADPSMIARQYMKSLNHYLSELKTVVRDAGIDYHRVRVQERYETVLARFLLARMPKRSK